MTVHSGYEAFLLTIEKKIKIRSECKRKERLLLFDYGLRSIDMSTGRKLNYDWLYYNSQL